MAPLTNAISSIIQRNGSFCRLCFGPTRDETTVYLRDSVSLSRNHSEELINILSCLLGREHTDNMSIFDSVCAECLKSIKTSYSFIRTCKENSDLLINAITSLEKCLQDTVTDVESFESLFISVDTKEGSSEQYYDSRCALRNRSLVLARYKYLNQGKYAMKKDTAMKGPRTRYHRYKDDILRICNVIRENNRSKYQCKVCELVFNKSFNFKKHYFSQHSEKKFKCTDCERSYGSETLLKQHKYDSHAKIICSECGKAYKNRYSLLYHMRTHSGQKPYECNFCQKKFQWASRRAEHIRQLHLEPNVTCDVCQITFRTLQSLYMHRKKHLDPNSKYFLKETPLLDTEEIGEEVSDEG